MGRSNFRKQLSFLNKSFQVNKWTKRVLLFLGLLLLLFLIFVRPPNPLFNVPYATLLHANSGQLLDAAIATDEQWRFPPLDSVPKKFKIASKLFEDEYFHYHPGVNPVSILRASHQNWKARKIVSGGSTITMQTIRMALGNQPRTYAQKMKEILLSFKLELTHSKNSIFELYANHAPFGANIVGLNAASWSYFSRPPHKLSWAEAATLAVLPNDPKSIFPGKNQKGLIEKRNMLLEKICKKGYFDKKDLELYKSEAVPGKIINLPNMASHLLQRAIAEGQVGGNIASTLDFQLQQKVTKAVKNYSAKMSMREIHNAATIIVEIETGQVLAYVGNSTNDDRHAKYVDIVTAPRSPGSLLKPMLYAAALDEGLIMPRQLINDVPMFHQGFIPKNFDRKFRGVVNADTALSSSLNVPFIHLLMNYGYQKFYFKLKKIGYHHLKEPPSYYGLTLILGTGATSLWELSAMYAGMARAYKNYFDRPLNRGYSAMDYRSNSYLKPTPSPSSEETLKNQGALSVAAIEATFRTMEQLKRPEEESGWNSFRSGKRIAWKTGTSYGYKDAWAIGLNDKYVVGVWVGNADGEPRPDLVGVRAAAPLMFHLFQFLKGKSILNEVPMGTLQEICVETGMLTNEMCPNKTYEPVSQEFLKATQKCTYHQSLKLNKEKTHRVNSNCYSVHEMVSKSYLMLSPIQAWYYKKYHPNYEYAPSFLSDCEIEASEKTFELIYPKTNTKILIPKEQNGQRGRVIFHAAHQNIKSKIFWHLNDTFIGATEEIHQMDVKAKKGKHSLVLIDDAGHEIRRSFEVVD